MKKILGVILGLFFVIPAVMAADVSDINKGAWLHHIKEMNIMRRQIIELNNKGNKTEEEIAAYNQVMAKFQAKQIEWDEYITAVANDDEEGRAKVENNFKKERHFRRDHRGHRCNKAEKCGKCPKNFKKMCECCKCEKCQCRDCECCKCGNCECKKVAKCHKPCQKAEKCGKCDKPCCKAPKCDKAEKCGKCDKPCCKPNKCDKPHCHKEESHG